MSASGGELPGNDGNAKTAKLPPRLTELSLSILHRYRMSFCKILLVRYLDRQA